MMSDRVSETWEWGFESGEMVLRQVEQGFSSFFDKFLAQLMIFQSQASRSDAANL